MRWNFIFFLALLFLCGCATERQTTLLTYNIQIGLQVDHKTPNLENTAEVIRKIGAETVVLNEVDKKTGRTGFVDQPAYLADKAGYPSVIFGRACMRHGGEYGNVVMSQFPLEKIALLDLPSNSYEPRSALVVKVLAPQPYYVVATHLTFEDTPEMEAVRVKAIDKIIDFIEEKQIEPVVLIGDLNTFPTGPVIARLRERNFTVINDIAPEELSWPADQPSMLLDYMAFYPADAAKIIDHKVQSEDKVSDHRPVTSTIVFLDKAE